MKKIKLEEKKQVKCSNKIELFDTPKYIEISLENNFLPILKQGDYVYQEEKIAFRKKDHFPLFSSVSGVITSIDTRRIVIKNDLQNRVRNHQIIEHSFSYTKEAIKDLLFQYGVMNTDINGLEPYQIFSLNHSYKTLIINALRAESYLDLESFLLKLERKQVIELTEFLIDVYNFEEVIIAVPDNQNFLLEECIHEKNIKIHKLEEYYALSNQRELVWKLKKVAYEKDATEKGIVVFNVSTLLAIYQTLKYQRPQIKKTTQFTGDMWKNNCYMEVRIGTPLKEILEKLKFKRAKEVLLLNGGIIGGKVASVDSFITPTSTIYTAWKVTNEVRKESCIRCGKCIKVCPVHLQPVLIMDAVLKNKSIKRYKSEKCIECGLCSYVCPSNIEVRELVSKAKETV